MPDVVSRPQAHSEIVLDAAAKRQQLRRAIVASAVGTSIEWYDFFLYSVASVLVFPQMFFPKSDPLVGTLLSLSTNFVGFASRPLGAVVFGHLGDRIGRKASLIATLLLMGFGTAAIGLVPGYETIGIWGAGLLTLGRVLQGIGIGGEWGGSVLLAAEWGDRRHRGFVASWPQFGAPAGMVLANGALALMSTMTSDTEFLVWGWRIPFLASLVLVAVGFYIRVGILETPVFARLRAAGQVQRAPVVEVLRHHWREVIFAALLRTGQQTPFYIFTTYVVTYGTQALKFPRITLLNFVVAQALLSMCTIPLFGHLSDRVGRRRLTVIGCLVMMVWPFIYFQLLDTRVLGLMFLAIMLGLPIHDLQYGPQAAVIAESFPGRVRYSGSSLGYQLASITAGGPAPIVAVWLYGRYGTSLAVATYVALTGLVSFISVWFLPDRSGEEL